MKFLSDLEFHLLNTKHPEAHQIDLVEKAFRFWQKSWQETFRSLGVAENTKLYADDFLDREAMVLADKGEPVALFFNSWFDLRESQLNHSYFKNYPSQVLDLMRSKYSRIMVLSYMTCDPSYRKSQTDLPISELLFSLGVLRFHSTPHEALFGYIRKDLSFYKVFENHGGFHICESNVYNVPVDYLYMTKESRRLSPVPGVAEVAQMLWSNSARKNLKAA